MNDAFYGEVLVTLFAEPSSAIKNVVESFMNRSVGTPFAAVHLRWSEATCSLRSRRKNHHPAVDKSHSGLGTHCAVGL